MLLKTHTYLICNVRRKDRIKTKTFPPPLLIHFVQHTPESTESFTGVDYSVLNHFPGWVLAVSFMAGPLYDLRH